MRARQDSGQDFIIIARCDEMYDNQKGGGGTSNPAEAIKRALAYAEAGADAVVFASCPPDAQPPLIKAVRDRVPVCTLGFNLPDTAFTLSTGWGWATAATNHLKMAKELMETGSVTSGNYAFPEKYELIQQTFFDELIREWAVKTGRPTREKSAP